MSIEAIQWALDTTEISSTAKHILTVLAFRANENLTCWPTIERLTLDTGISQRNLSRGLKELSDKNLINKKLTGRAAIYTILMQRCQNGISDTPKWQGRDAKMAHQTCQNGTSQDTQDTQECQNGISDTPKWQGRDAKMAHQTCQNGTSQDTQDTQECQNGISDMPKWQGRDAKMAHQTCQNGTQKDQEKKEEKSKKDQSLPSTDVEGADADASAREREENTETSTSKKKPKTRDDYDPRYVEFAEKYQAAVLEKHGNLAPPVTESLICQCAKTIDLCVRVDKISFDELKDCLRWAFNDDFWGEQLRSLAAIRSKSKNGLKKIQNAMTKYKNSLQASAHVQQPTQTSSQQPTQQPATPTEWQYRQQEQRLQVDKYFRMKEELERLERLEQEEDVNAK